MTSALVSCPYCGGTVSGSSAICPDCHEDLSALVRLEHGHLVHYNQALALAKEGAFEEARAKLLLVLALNESYVPAHALLAKVLAALERWPEARVGVARALDLAPEDAKIARLQQDIEKAAERDEEYRESATQVRRSQAEGVLSSYQRDIARAFVVGIGVASILGMIVSRLGGGADEEDEEA